MKKIGLRIKFSLLIFFLICLIMTFVIWIVSTKVKEMLEKEMILRGELIAKTLSSDNVAELLMIEKLKNQPDDLTFANLIKEAMKNKSMVYAMILDDKQKIRAHNDINMWEKPYILPKGLKKTSKEILVQLYLSTKGDAIYDISYPILLGKTIQIGTVHIGLSQNNINKAIAKTITNIILVILTTLIIGLFGTLILVNFMIKPIQRLRKGVLEVAKGDFEQFIEVKSNDEIGELTHSFNEMTKSLKEKELIKNAFARYVTKQVLDVILKNPEKVALIGEKRKVAILFADLRGFTSLSENLNPEKVVKLLNNYLSLITDVVFHYEGTVDKFIGDCVMAVFGAPIVHSDDSYRAIKTAVDIQVILKEYNKKQQEKNEPELPIGIGIDIGEVISGNIGSKQRTDYTVIGDHVNIAARLEDLADGGQILITKNAYEIVKEYVVAEKLPLVRIKGKTQSIQIYNVIGLKNRKKVIL